MRTRPLPTILLTAPLLLGLCVACTTADRGSDGQGAGGMANASCAAPYLDTTPPNTASEHPAPLVDPGDSVTVYGHWYTSTCNDTGLHDPLEALAPVHLTLTLPGGESKDMGTFTPTGPDMGFTAVARIPRGTPAGAATISDDQEHPSVYRFRVGGIVPR